MHPILARPGRLLPYLAACLPLAAIVTALLARRGGLFLGESIALAVPLTAAYAFMGLSAWYPCRQFPLTRSRALPLALTHSLAAAIIAGFWVMFAVLLGAAYGSLDVFRGLPGRLASQGGALFAAGVLLYLLAAALSYVLLSLEAAAEAEQREAQMQILAREAELAVLRAQIRPHFLFNSLNSISGLATTEPAKAQEMCVRLADFLRKSLAVGERPTISVAEELALSRSYLQVEALRFGERLEVEEDLDARGDACQVPPLLLQPLIENAVRHGIASRIEGGKVRVSVACSAGRLRILIENPLDPDAPSRPGIGVGLSNVRQRLAARWGSEGLFAARRLADRFLVVISVPAEVRA